MHRNHTIIIPLSCFYLTLSPSLFSFYFIFFLYYSTVINCNHNRHHSWISSECYWCMLKCSSDNQRDEGFLLLLLFLLVSLVWSLKVRTKGRVWTMPKQGLFGSESPEETCVALDVDRYWLTDLLIDFVYQINEYNKIVPEVCYLWAIPCVVGFDQYFWCGL